MSKADYSPSIENASESELRAYMKRPDFLLVDSFGRIIFKGEEKWLEEELVLAENENVVKGLVPKNSSTLSLDNQQLIHTFDLRVPANRPYLVTTMFLLAAYCRSTI